MYIMINNPLTLNADNRVTILQAGGQLRIRQKKNNLIHWVPSIKFRTSEWRACNINLTLELLPSVSISTPISEIDISIREMIQIVTPQIPTRIGRIDRLDLKIIPLHVSRLYNNIHIILSSSDEPRRNTVLFLLLLIFVHFLKLRWYRYLTF